MGVSWAPWVWEAPRQEHPQLEQPKTSPDTPSGDGAPEGSGSRIAPSGTPVHMVALEVYVELVHPILNANEIPSSAIYMLCDPGQVTCISEPQYPPLP